MLKRKIIEIDRGSCSGCDDGSSVLFGPLEYCAGILDLAGRKLPIQKVVMRSGFISPFCIFQSIEKQRVGNTCETASGLKGSIRS